MKRVEVTWKDITSDGDGWHSMDEIDKFLSENNIVKTLGYIYEEDEDQVVILDSYFIHKELLGGIHRIPKGCILDIKELTYI